MRLYDLKLLNFDNPVSSYIELDDSATIKDITIRQLLTHTAGLTPFIPFYKSFTEDNFYKYFSTTQRYNFSHQSAHNMFINDSYKDSMWQRMIHSSLKNKGKYNYSDISMYILQRVVESISKLKIDSFSYEAFYKPMNLKLCFNPIKKYSLSSIIPTEYDKSFRHQLIHGFVHDQGACLYGGVAGHAGLFGNATDVATLMQMLLDKGNFGENQLFNPNTIEYFTQKQSSISRRGLGFDKPSLENNGPTSNYCSPSTFGHLGFTGTCAWADPENDLVFVFLSNRIHPSVDNLKLGKGDYRQNLQTLFYKYIKTVK